MVASDRSEVGWLAILDLFLEDASACDWARATTLSTIRGAIGAAGGIQIELPARDVRDCVRRVAGGWNFRDVELPADVELFATLALTPGA